MLNYLGDLASDFSAIHGVRDMLALPGPVFFALAGRLSAYQGVMAARAAEQEAETGPTPQGHAEPRAPAPADAPTPRAVLQNDAAFKGIFSFGTMTPA